MERVDTLEWGHHHHREGIAPSDPQMPAKSRGDESPFFWWVRALLAAGGAIALFPVVFAVAVKVIDLSV